MGKDKLSIKICNAEVEFFKNLKRNRIKADIDMIGLSYWEMVRLIVNYFKSNNDEYLKLVQMEYKK